MTKAKDPRPGKPRPRKPRKKKTPPSAPSDERRGLSHGRADTAEHAGGTAPRSTPRGVRGSA